MSGRGSNREKHERHPTGAVKPRGARIRLGGVADTAFEDDEALDEEFDEGEEIEDPEPQLDPEVIARRDAALAQVVKFGDPILKTKARRIERFDETLRNEVARMSRLMHEGFGIGLAANQVGVLHRLLVYRVQHDGPIAALINPEVEWHSGEEEIALEGCLSIPQIHVEVERPVHVRVRAQDEFGEALTIEASGLEARVLQHEIDHLDGVLMINRTTREQRKEAMRALRER
jgi:peptide deformylase